MAGVWTPASATAPPGTLSTLVAGKIDKGIGYLPDVCRVFFDGITVFLQVMLNAITPAMAANLVAAPWTVDDIVALVEKADDAAPKKRGPYKPRTKKDISN